MQNASTRTKGSPIVAEAKTPQNRARETSVCGLEVSSEYRTGISRVENPAEVGRTPIKNAAAFVGHPVKFSRSTKTVLAEFLWSVVASRMMITMKKPQTWVTVPVGQTCQH